MEGWSNYSKILKLLEEGWSIDSNFIKAFHDKGLNDGIYILPIDENVPMYIYDLLPFHGLENFPDEHVEHGFLSNDIEEALGEGIAANHVLTAVDNAGWDMPRNVNRAVVQLRTAITMILDDIFRVADSEAEQRGSNIDQIQDVRHAVRYLYPSFIAG